MKCRHCNNQLEHVFLDLGFAPASNAYLSTADLYSPEKYFPLKLFVCDECWLVQTEDYNAANELFSADYAYFSSVSSSWLEHARQYCEMVTRKLQLNSKSLVVELASNDGYLLKNFVAENIPCLGIEPTDSTAAAAEKLGIPVLRKFFGVDLANTLVAEEKQADLIIGNNVYAHVPDINDFSKGMKILLRDNGTITLEFPHLLKLIEHNQFDTVYHEHYSYLSLTAVATIFHNFGLRVFDVEEITTHGGSLRIYGCHDHDSRSTTNAVVELLNREQEFGLCNIGLYANFQKNANRVKNDFIEFLIKQYNDGKKVAAYGAAAKGNTLINYSGIKPDLLPVVFDAAPSKQGKYLPGSHIPILNPDQITEYKPDYLIILPWNIAPEVINSMSSIKEWGGAFVTFVPNVKVYQ